MACVSCKTEKCSCSALICTNPLIYLIKDAMALVGTKSIDYTIVTTLNTLTTPITTVVPSAPYQLTLPQALVKLLRDGINISTNKELCCPDCSSKINIFGNFARMTEQITAYGLQSANKLCCFEHQSSDASATSIDSLWVTQSTTPVKCCNTDFSDVIQQWITSASYITTGAYTALFYLDSLIGPPTGTGAGFFETSSYNGFSGIGLLYNYLQLNAPTLTQIDYLNILGILSTYGVKIECTGCSISIKKIKP